MFVQEVDIKRLKLSQTILILKCPQIRSWGSSITVGWENFLIEMVVSVMLKTGENGMKPLSHLYL
jgi:hypothetical protein